jgi:hypothetical protein
MKNANELFGDGYARYDLIGRSWNPVTAILIEGTCALGPGEYTL